MYPQRMGCYLNNILLNIKRPAVNSSSLALPRRALTWKDNYKSCRRGCVLQFPEACAVPNRLPCASVFGLSCWRCLGGLWHLWGMAPRLAWPAGDRRWRWDLLLLLVQNCGFLHHLAVSKVRLQTLGPQTDHSSHRAFPITMDGTPKTVNQDKHFLH